MTENNVVTKDHFSDLRTQLKKIKEENASIVFDYEAEEKAARSHVAKLRKSKTAISNLHKEKKKFFLEEGRKIDAAKNELTAEVEEMIAVHAEPLQAIKDRKEAEIEAERKRVEMELDWDSAIAENDLFNREREIARKEQEQARIREEAFQKAEAERIEKERIEREERLKKEAAEQAIKDAEEKARKEKEESERLIREAAEREEALKREAEEAEKKRLADIEAEKQRAEREKQEALAQQKREQEEKERLERERLAEAKRIEDARKADEDHRRTVNNLILSHFVDAGLSEDASKKLIGIIVTGGVPNLSINY